MKNKIIEDIIQASKIIEKNVIYASSVAEYFIVFLI